MATLLLKTTTLTSVDLSVPRRGFHRRWRLRRGNRWGMASPMVQMYNLIDIHIVMMIISIVFTIHTMCIYI